MIYLCSYALLGDYKASLGVYCFYLHVAWIEPSQTIQEMGCMVQQVNAFAF